MLASSGLAIDPEPDLCCASESLATMVSRMLSPLAVQNMLAAEAAENYAVLKLKMVIKNPETEMLLHAVVQNQCCQIQ